MLEFFSKLPKAKNYKKVLENKLCDIDVIIRKYCSDVKILSSDTGGLNFETNFQLIRDESLNL